MRKKPQFYLIATHKNPTLTVIAILHSNAIVTPTYIYIR